MAESCGHPGTGAGIRSRMNEFDSSRVICSVSIRYRGAGGANTQNPGTRTCLSANESDRQEDVPMGGEVAIPRLQRASSSTAPLSAARVSGSGNPS